MVGACRYITGFNHVKEVYKHSAPRGDEAKSLQALIRSFSVTINSRRGSQKNCFELEWLSGVIIMISRGLIWNLTKRFARI